MSPELIESKRSRVGCARADTPEFTFKGRLITQIREEIKIFLSLTLTDKCVLYHLCVQVWCASIVRDDWAACRVEAPADELQRRLFFRLIDLVHLMGGEVELVLPGAEELLAAPALSALAQDARFGYILKYGYECLAARDPPPAPA
ncbi:nuclear pore complex protein Nup133-like [Ostrinia furnacalis]|uniref:nuclear pore complex protein Nup133-like n=1 Tax=Ostrinia furnacalis TaxID=93504 RepID=UPI00103C561A|nr:nuclear pore complex protein Nup133-like [Ostrinia furnacalis]